MKNIKNYKEFLNEGSDWILLKSINKLVDEYSGDFLNADKPLYDTICVDDPEYDELVNQLSDEDRETYNAVMDANKPME